VKKTSYFVGLAVVFVLFSACSLNNVALAAEASTSDHSAHTYDSLVNIAPFGARVGASVGLGSFKDSTGAIPSRTMDTLGFQVMPGLSLE
jgi:hypothetical protein